jgi:hypothetical protein
MASSKPVEKYHPSRFGSWFTNDYQLEISNFGQLRAWNKLSFERINVLLLEKDLTLKNV